MSDQELISSILLDKDCQDFYVEPLSNTMERCKFKTRRLIDLAKYKFKRESGRFDSVFKISLFRRCGFSEELLANLSDDKHYIGKLKDLLAEWFFVPMFASPQDKTKAIYCTSQSNEYVFVLLTGTSATFENNLVIIGAAILNPTSSGCILELFGVNDSENDLQFITEMMPLKQRQPMQFRYDPETKKGMGIGTLILITCQRFLKNAKMNTEIYAHVNSQIKKTPIPFYCRKIGCVEWTGYDYELEKNGLIDLTDLVILKSPVSIDSVLQVELCRSPSISAAILNSCKIVFEDFSLTGDGVTPKCDFICKLFNNTNNEIIENVDMQPLKTMKM